jgi:DNA-binding Xre family transcriptional regulator
MTAPYPGPPAFDAALFARALRACLSERRKTVREAALETGVNQATINLIANDKKTGMNLETFARLCRWMRVPVGLFFVEGER